jgi:hypothetical protein
MAKSPKYPLPAADISDRIEQQRRVIRSLDVYVQERPYNYYEAHPEHRPRRLSPRDLRRQRIRERF